MAETNYVIGESKAKRISYTKAEIDNKFQTKAEAYTEKSLKSLYVELTGTITLSSATSGSLEISYPTGFTQTNTWVISSMMLMIPNGTNNMTSGFTPAFANNPRITLMSSYIELFCSFSSATTGTFKYKVLLMKSLS